MHSPFNRGGEQQAADFASMQSAAIALEAFAVSLHDAERTYSTTELMQMKVGRAIGERVMAFPPTDAELIVFMAKPRSLSTTVHSLILREGEPYVYKSHSQDVDIQAIGAREKTLTGIYAIEGDLEARHAFIQMGTTVHQLGRLILGEVRERTSKNHFRHTQADYIRAAQGMYSWLSSKDK